MSRDIAVVSGYLVRCPLGGYFWQVLHYLSALEALGYEAYFYEDTRYYSDCFDPASGNMTDDPHAGVDAAARFFAQHGMPERWLFDDTWRGRTFGLDAPARDAIIHDARVWITLAAVNRLPPARVARGHNAFIDIDPGYTQISAAAGEAALVELLAEHQVHFTIGERIGSRGCAVPTGGFEWRPTRQPVVLSLWEPAPPDAAAPYTTIGRWDERRREVEVNGEVYSWRKRSEWMKFLTLPERTGERFRLAMDVAKVPEDLTLLQEHGWEVVDPLTVSMDPEAYRAFVRGSKGEFTVAKDLNVRLRTGWFSDRAACYLAAGRPVVNQDTGFDEALRVGDGLFAFRELDSAVGALEVIKQSHPAQCAGARRVAEEFFAAERVLPALLAAVA